MGVMASQITRQPYQWDFLYRQDYSYWIRTLKYLSTRSIIPYFDLVRLVWLSHFHSDVIMNAMVSQITGVSIVCLAVCSGADQRKHQSSASFAFVRGIHRWPVDFHHKGPVTRKMSSWRRLRHAMEAIYFRITSPLCGNYCSFVRDPAQRTHDQSDWMRHPAFLSIKHRNPEIDYKWFWLGLATGESCRIELLEIIKTKGSHFADKQSNRGIHLSPSQYMHAHDLFNIQYLDIILLFHEKHLNTDITDEGLTPARNIGMLSTSAVCYRSSRFSRQIHKFSIGSAGHQICNLYVIVSTLFPAKEIWHIRTILQIAANNEHLIISFFNVLLYSKMSVCISRDICNYHNFRYWGLCKVDTSYIYHLTWLYKCIIRFP